MLDFINVILNAFKSYVLMLFQLPFYGSVTWGYALLALYIIALILFIVGGRFK